MRDRQCRRILLAIAFSLARGIGAGQEAANAFVDSNICAGCHAAYFRSYEQTGMARSFSRPRVDMENLAKGLPYQHSATGAIYSISARGGQLYQSRWQLGPGGEKINRAEWRIDYVMGSGSHARTYLHRAPDGSLIELPLAWYSEKGGYWAMNPGFDSGQFVAPRKITYECMFCHNAYPRIPAGHEKANSVPAYLDPLPEGIDCQRCHGPGGNHARLAQRGAAVEEVRKVIVNPARLPADRQMEVCMQCHLQTTSRRLPAQIRRFDRGPFSYRAGEPLDRFALFFERGAANEKNTGIEIDSSAVRLRESRCFLQSKGAMTCLSCHDPHHVERGEAAQRRYNEVCRNCHANAFDALIAARKHTAEPGCVGCHMPKRRTVDVVHAVMTDHRIQRVKPAGDLLAEIAEVPERAENGYRGPVVPYYPKPFPSSGEDRLYLAAAQVWDGSNVAAGVEQLSAEIAKQHPRAAEFYIELGDGLRLKGDAGRAVTAYEQAMERDPKSVWALRRLAGALMATGAKTRALEMLNRSIAAAPDDAHGWYALGDVDLSLGRKAEAILAFQKSATLDPEFSEAWNALGGALADSGKFVEAQNALETALRVQPDLVDAQANLAMLLASKGDLSGAIFHFEQALKSAPGNVAARCNYAVALARQNRPEQAEKQLRIALQTDPKFPQAHLDLALLLADRGNFEEAAEHLRKAADGSNPAIRQRALDLLRQIGK
jgi:predicted CXXCH cytochrome family protein